MLTQKALKAEVSKVLHQIGRSCCSIKTEHPAHYQFLLEVLKRHPDPDKGQGVLDMHTVGIPAWRFPTVILLKENVEEDVSLLKHCIRGRGLSKHESKMKEYRELIRPQIVEFRASANLECCQCGSTAELHVDHIFPFSKIVAEYDGEISFEDFHRERATYQILCASCNIKKSNK